MRLHTGVRKLDDMLQVFWYQAQLHRMADGLEPDVRLSKARALLHSVSTTFLPKLGPRAPEVPIHAAASPSA